MPTILPTTSLNMEFAQIAWVVNDIHATEKFFTDTMGITTFSKVATSRATDYKGTYYGVPSDGENLFSQAYSGGIFIELIQPISGNSVFMDYLDKNPAGGIQHYAYRIPIAKLNEAIAAFAAKGFPVISRFDTFIADIVF